MAFQNAMIAKGWLDNRLLESSYGVLDEVTYAAVWEIQSWYKENVGTLELTPVKDENGSYRDEYGVLYPIDEATYLYIMRDLESRPSH